MNVMNKNSEKKGTGTILCIGLTVLDILAMPIDRPETWKEKQRIERISLLPGGDAVNQSIYLAALGLHAMLNGTIGADNAGKTLRQILTARGVDTSLLREKREYATGTSLVLVSPEGERRIFSAPGAHSVFDGGDLVRELPENCAAVSVASIYGMPLAEENGLEELLAQARQRGIPVFADLNSGKVVPATDAVRRLLPYIDYLLPSLYDLEPFTGKSDPAEAAAWLRDLGVGEVIVKCGGKGALVFGRDCQEAVPALPVKPVDTTGAGDCMNAAFIARILAGDLVRDACAYACAAGSLSTLSPGANGYALSDARIRQALREM